MYMNEVPSVDWLKHQSNNPVGCITHVKHVKKGN